MLHRFFTSLVAIALLTLVYFAAGRLGLSMALVHPSATAVWPPTGIALAALLVLGQRVWPGILLGAFLVNATTSSSIPASFAIAVGNTLEGVIGAYLVTRLANGRLAFEQAADTVKFAVLAGLVSTAVSATFGVTSLVLYGLAFWANYPAIWLTWWLGDAGGALIVAPALILWANDFRLRWDQAQAIEIVFLSSLLVLTALVTFGELSPVGIKNYPLEFLVVTLVVWIAYRFGPREAASATVLLAGIAVWGTIHGFGPFVMESRNESLLLLQSFTAVIAVTGLGLAALVSERRRIEHALRQTNLKLRGGLTQLEQRNSEMAEFSEMSHLLQGCLTMEEAGTVLTQFTPRLFAAVRGGVYLMNESRTVLETGIFWGAPPLTQRLFALEDCWALRRGRAHHVVAAADTGMPCRHLGNPQPAAAVCIPMIAQGETVGVLHLQCPPLAPAERLNESVRHFAQTVADGVALTLANLKLRETLRQQSIRDPLTGLFNRRYLEESLERELQRAKRNRSQVGVIMLDFDHFKDFNDTFGHAAGDVLLRELGQFLVANVRDEDIACRYGGEEFLLLLPDTALAATEQRAEEVWKGVKQLQVPFHDEALGPITVSVGVAVFPEHGTVGAALLRAADAALYQAKNSGRDRVVVAYSAPAAESAGR